MVKIARSTTTNTIGLPSEHSIVSSFDETDLVVSHPSLFRVARPDSEKSVSQSVSQFCVGSI